MRNFGRAVSAGALGLAILTAGVQVGAAAEDEDNSPSIWNLDTRLWNGIMSAMGMKANTEVGIDYRERSPLVVPPQPDLPPPQAAPAKTAAWPVDPESKRRIEAARKPKNIRGWDADYEADNLNPSQLGPRGSKRDPANVDSGISDPVKPSELGFFGWSFKSLWGDTANRDEIGNFTAEPPRTALTAPPTGYQTPSPAQPYGNSRRVEWNKPKKADEENR
jgi:hypothetical protein